MAKRKAIPKAVRDKLLADAMSRCCLCPEHPDVVDVHHIVPISEDGPNTEDNLIVVCGTCHDRIHRSPNRYTPEQLRMYKEWWVGLCKLGLPLDVRMALALDYTRSPELGRKEWIEEGRLPSPASIGGEGALLNPFCDRGRINYPPRFFNRQRILRELRQMLAAGNSISLVGDSEIGKSSVLYYLYQNRVEWLPEIPVLYLDLQSVLDEDDFCAEVLEGLGQEPGDLRVLRQALRRRGVILFLDEVEKLADSTFSTRLHHLLRALAQEDTLTLAVASHRPLVDIFLPSSPGSPFHNIFTERRLGPFSPEDARAFLAHRLQGTEVTFASEEIEQIVRESDGHPARLQRLAYDLFEQKRS